MKVTKDQFEVLSLIERKQGTIITYTEIVKSAKVSMDIAEKTLAELKEAGLIKTVEESVYVVTEKGYEALEPHRVKRAIFMAAGFGSRMVPITLNTPKPLVYVNGKRIIETLLDAVVEAGITDIIIVRGYLGDQFDTLLKKYPTIKFVDNPIYNEANSISSAYLVRDLFANSYVFDSDLVLHNKSIIRKYEYATSYLTRPVDSTDDWCFYMEDGYIAKYCKGGENVQYMYGISYWTPEDAAKIEKDLEDVYNSPGGKELYWEEAPLRVCLKDYKVGVRLVEEGDVIEIDTFEELKQIDPIYNV